MKMFLKLFSKSFTTFEQNNSYLETAMTRNLTTMKQNRQALA